MRSPFFLNLYVTISLPGIFYIYVFPEDDHLGRNVFNE